MNIIHVAYNPYNPCGMLQNAKKTCNDSLKSFVGNHPLLPIKLHVI